MAALATEARIKKAGRSSVNDRLLRAPRSPLKIDQNNNPSDKIIVGQNLPSDLFISFKGRKSAMVSGVKPQREKKHDFSSNNAQKLKLSANDLSIAQANKIVRNKDKNKSNKEYDHTTPTDVTKEHSKAKRSLKFSFNVSSDSESTSETKRSMNDRLLKPVKHPRPSISKSFLADAVCSMSISNDETDETTSNGASKVQQQIGSINRSLSFHGDSKMTLTPSRTSNVFKWRRLTGSSKPKIISKERLACTETQIDCICKRDLKRIMCKVCGHHLVGRIRQLCTVHPRDVFLLDINECPVCKAPNSLKEFSFPNGSYPKDAINNRLDN